MQDLIKAPNSNLRHRILSAIPAIVVVLIILYSESFWLAGLVIGMLCFVGSHEYSRLNKAETTADSDLFPLQLPFASALLTLGMLLFEEPGLQAGLFLSLLWLGWRFIRAPESISTLYRNQMMAKLFGLIWITWCFHHVTLLLTFDQGREWLLTLLVMVWANDIFAYFGGRQWGRTPLLPEVSPKKTREGFYCGFLGSVVIGGLSALLFLRGLAGWEGLLLGALVGAVSPFGDLVESRMKRLAGVKDSGRFLPGHGGLLDRVDALLLAAPVVYYMNRICFDIPMVTP